MLQYMVVLSPYPIALINENLLLRRNAPILNLLHYNHHKKNYKKQENPATSTQENPCKEWRAFPCFGLIPKKTATC